MFVNCLVWLRSNTIHSPRIVSYTNGYVHTMNQFFSDLTWPRHAQQAQMLPNIWEVSYSYIRPALHLVKSSNSISLILICSYLLQSEPVLTGSHHPSTPQAGAHSSGGVWLVAVVGCAVVIGAIPPAIHPMSSCSWGWRWLVGQPGVQALSNAIVGS